VQTTTQPTPAVQSPLLTRAWYANYVLVLLTLGYVINTMDRSQILAASVQAIKKEFAASDFQMGVLTGVPFALFYSFMGIPIAAWADRLAVSQGLLAVVLVMAFLYAWAAEFVGGIAAITGSYLAGVLFAQTRVKSQIDAGIHPLTYSMLVPVFFISIGLIANGRVLGGQIGFTAILVLVAIVTKAVGCGLFARLSGFDTTASVRVGVGMISRGEVGLIVAGYGLANGLIGIDVFSAAVITVLVTTMVTPPLLRLVFSPPPYVSAPRVEETIAGPPEETQLLNQAKE